MHNPGSACGLDAGGDAGVPDGVDGEGVADGGVELCVVDGLVLPDGALCPEHAASIMTAAAVDVNNRTFFMR